MIKIAIQVDSKNELDSEFLRTEIGLLLDRVQENRKQREEEPAHMRMDAAFIEHSTKKIPSHDEVESIIA